MLIDWLQFGPSLLLLLTPIALFQGSRVRFRPIPSSFEGHWGRTLGLGLHTIDLGRAVLGAWLLAEALSVSPEAKGAIRHAVPATQAAVLIVGILLQTFVCKEPDAANPPFAYVTGIVLGFLPLHVGAFALFVAAVASFGVRWAAVFFPLLTCTIIGAGLLFGATKILFSLGAIGCAVMVPWLFTLLFPRHFVVAYAAKRSTPSRTHSPMK